jgi:hypothetical protein
MWQLLSHGAVLGTTGPELPISTPRTRAWPLVPTSAFDSVQPLVASLADLQQSNVGGVPPELLAIADEDDRAREIQSWLQSSPENRRRIDLYDRFTALDLRLVSDDGEPLPASSIVVAELPPPGEPFVPSMRADFAEAGFAAGPPFYMVVASVATTADGGVTPLPP